MTKKSTNVRIFQGLSQTMIRALPEVSTDLASYYFFRTRRFEPKSDEKAVAARSTKIRVGDLHGYHWKPATEPRKRVLLVHGWNGRPSQFYKLIAALNENGCEVYAFDLPSHGSTPGKETNIFEMSDAVQKIIPVFPNFDVVIAHSIGCAATLRALSVGVSIPRAVLIAPPDSVDGIIDTFARFVGMDSSVQNRFRKKIEARVGQEFDQLDVSEMAKTISADFLVVHDRKDREIPFSTGERVADTLKAEFLITEGLGHNRVLRDPDTIQKMLEFVDHEIEAVA